MHVAAGQWWCILGRQRQVGIFECEARLVYRSSSRTGSKATQKNLVSKETKQQSNEKSR